MTTITRKNFLLTGVATLGTAVLARPALASGRYVIRFGIDLASNHPSTVHARAAAAEIKAATDGKVIVKVFPNSELGDDTHMLSEVRTGAMQMMAIGDNILSTLVPSVAIDNLGFAFKDSQAAWTALDGKVGNLVRTDIEAVGLHPMSRIWDEGFRQMTSKSKRINSPADLAGFKIRVPPSPISLSLFKHLGAAPTVINLAELYTSLQTGVVDGQENPLSLIQTQKFYEVQKYCALTNHMWVGYWPIVNGDFWKRMPANYQKIVSNAFDKQALLQRSANLAQNNSLQTKLTNEGMVFNAPDLKLFRDKLVASGFYSEWKAKFSPTLWNALESYVGTLA
ncbi:tripartite ATP-independent transporter solute receptor, DctP family [Acidocella aminolytica 101 = DSM 11237]|uniref:TRAP dicarboxylate transporter subunit DctP n=1 Tax=Acidocella aminolytica 101 = DSM 11237 TaxID=1120923 RepID=A0A0D6PIN4_9PROT|nr:TRAP dicarboxylate transporter subunit DctP [Acidocella aminolytica 101 = DSM 11237]GBQ40819.1 TRAP dicarboxylate transporter subunit DctP [Acidocella aminolytica 101 = DSM 11237]SHF26434.1 tripartite ATP-independent transporter solute receptor, DctP family [Acidocella aminolytica 101 = DSM 11237]